MGLHPSSRLPVHPPEILAAMRGRLPEYLAARGVDLRGNGSRLTGRCPVHDDKHPSFSVFGEGHTRCGCHPCGFQGDVFAVSQWLGRSSTFPEAVADVAATLGVQVGTAATPFPAKGRVKKTTVIPSTPPAIPMKHADLSETDLALISAARCGFSVADDSGDLHALAMELRIPVPVLRRAAAGDSGLGWHRGQLAYLYPHGMKVRAAPGQRPRFLWVCGTARAPWRMERVTPGTRTIYLCEGESDCLTLTGIGLEADGTALCVASPGTSFPAAWAPLFAGKEVVICFDKDEAGRTATRRVADLLHGHAAKLLSWKNSNDRSN